MKLLICTQKVDRNDSVLGFFHRWIQEFAKHCEKVIVVCLEKGEYDLPNNVEVLSLGKELKNIQYPISNIKFFCRLKFVFRFYYYIWKFRKEYNGVFVHMNTEYVLLGGIFWLLFRKRMALWYNHRQISWKLRLSAWIVERVFHTSPYAASFRFKNSLRMPAGIDTNMFVRLDSVEKNKKSILYLGRISPIKGVDVLIKAVALLHKRGQDCVLNIVGEAIERDKEYLEKVKIMSRDLLPDGKVNFFGKAVNYQTPEMYNQNAISVNLSPSGLYDKTILEAMASETLVVLCNKSFEEVLPAEMIFIEGDVENLADKLSFFLDLEESRRKIHTEKLRKYVVENHELKNLIPQIIKLLK